MNPTTPDGRYFVLKGPLWRCSNPLLSEDVRQLLVNELMDARRQVKAAKASAILSNCQWLLRSTELLYHWFEPRIPVKNTHSLSFRSLE